jgi:hypothetical protein
MVSIRMRPSFAIKEDCKIVIFICAMEFATTNKGQHGLCEACYKFYCICLFPKQIQNSNISSIYAL